MVNKNKAPKPEQTAKKHSIWDNRLFVLAASLLCAILSWSIVTLTLDMIAQVEAKEEDLDDISAFVGGVEGVHTGVTIRELRPGVCKISLRTEPGELNASAVCAILGGGGHAAAAGATVEGDPAYTRTVLVEAIRQVQGRDR